jgi:hypothetical protein
MTLSLVAVASEGGSGICTWRRQKVAMTGRAGIVLYLSTLPFVLRTPSLLAASHS